MPRIVPSEVVRVIERFYTTVTDERKFADERLAPAQAGRISAIVSLVDRVPLELLTLPPDEYADLIAEVELLRTRVPIFIRRGEGITFDAAPVRNIYLALLKCPDQFPASTVHDLPFITDAALRDTIRLDIDNAERALVNGDWKAATVMGGAAIEALLLWKLTTLPWTDVEAAGKSVEPKWKNTVPPLHDRQWHLPVYIEVAAVVPIPKPTITSTTATLLRLVKTYRNLIHPGAAVRTAAQCDKRTAHTAIAGVAGTIADISR